jgi:hypothetical protein
MNANLRAQTGGVRSLVQGLAESGSMMGTWSEQRPQSILLERSGTVDMVDFDKVNASFEARRYFDDRHRLRTIYLARVAGTRELTLEELPEHAKNEMARAVVASSNGEELVIKTDAMSTEPDEDGDPWDFAEEDGYHHAQSVEYRINGNGEILECARSDAYDHDGEEIVTVRYSEPYRRGKLAVELVYKEHKTVGTDFAIANKKTLKQELAVDMALLEYASEYRNDRVMTELSRREHEGRLFAIAAFITMRADPIESLQIALS